MHFYRNTQNKQAICFTKKPTVFGDTKFLSDTQIYYALTSITELMTLRPCGDTLMSSLSLEISER